MAVPTYPSAISLNDIQTEFGGSNPIEIGEYYSGGSRVPSYTTNATSVVIPTSGQISFLNFSGAAMPSGLPVSYTYQSSVSSGSITIPTNAANISITLQGTGGGGGGWNGSQSRKGAGGGGGGSLGVLNLALTSGDWGKSFSWALGTRGTGGAGDTKYSGSSGTAGGQCNVVFTSFSFGSVTYYVNGGGGGSSGGAGGAGGTTSGNGNYWNYTGGAGGSYLQGGYGGSPGTAYGTTGSQGIGGQGGQTSGANGANGEYGYLSIYIQ